MGDGRVSVRYIKQVLGAPEHPSEVAGFRHFTTEVRVPGYHLVGKLAASGERVVYDSTVVVPEVVWQDAAAHLVFDVLDYQSRLRALFDMWGNELAEGYRLKIAVSGWRSTCSTASRKGCCGTSCLRK